MKKAQQINEIHTCPKSLNDCAGALNQGLSVRTDGGEGDEKMPRGLGRKPETAACRAAEYGMPA